MTIPKQSDAVRTEAPPVVAELLQTVSAEVHQLLARCAPGDPLHDMVDHVRQTIDRITILTRQFGAPGARRAMRATALDLNSVAQQMAPSLHRLLGPFITLETMLHPPGLWIAGERGQVEQITLGLLINAREALPLGGNVCLSTRHYVLTRPLDFRVGSLPPGEWAMLEVRDNGGGLDDATLRHFVDLTARGSTFESSLSLGTVASLVHQLGGHVVLDTGGAGSVLAACFPVIPARRSRQPATGVASAVLIVEDDAWTRLSAARTLRRAGYGVLEAEHADAAHELLDDVAGTCIRLMLVDVGLAYGGPRPLGERVRHERPDVELLVTAPPRERPSEPGEPAVLEKPFSSDALLRAVRDRLVAPA